MATSDTKFKDGQSVPRGAVRHYAGGGLIDSLKRTLGMGPPETISEKYARQDAERAAKAPKPIIQPAPAPATAMPQDNSLKARIDRAEKEALGMKAGGAVRHHPVGKIVGKGTGTSDQVPIDASNGEFIIKTAAVKKIGLETLEALNAIADKPDEKDSKSEKLKEYGDAESKSEDMGEKPGMEMREKMGMKCGGAVRKMAAGGLVEDPEKARRLKLPDQPLAQTFQNTPQKFMGSASPTTAAPAMPKVAQPTTSGPNGASGSWEPNTVPAPEQTGGATGTWQAPVTPIRPEAVAVQAPATPSTPQVENQNGYLPNESVMGRAGRRVSEVGAGFLGGMKSLGQAMNLGAPGAATGMPFNASAGAGRGAVPAGTQVGINESSPVAPPSVIPVAAAATAPAQPGSPAAIAAGASSPASTPAKLAPTMAVDNPTQPSPGQVAKTVQPNGVTSYSGSNITGDVSLTGNRGGVISAQNNQAAENLARASGQTRGFGPSGAIRGGGQISTLDTSAGYASDLKQLAGIDAAKAAQETNMQAQADYAANKVLEGRALAGNRGALRLLAQNKDNAVTTRNQDIQAGATRATQQLAQDKLKLDTAKDSRDATAAGFTSRSAGRIEALQAAYEAAKPGDKAAIAEQLRVMTGKDKPAQWKALALQGATDSMGNKTEGVLAAVNEQTGEVKRLDQGQGQSINTDARAVAIRDNQSLTREQKIAELKKIGFQ